jgi:DNA modification methylase
VEYISEGLRALAVPIESLNLDPANARLHDQRNVDAVKGSLARFGQRQPLVVQRQGMIVRAGNARLVAAKALGWTHVAALIVDEGNVEATAYAIADNRTAELAEWDDQALARLIAEIDDPELREVTGFTDEELEEIVNGSEPPEIVEDEPPPVPEVATSKPGQLWALGDHRVLCGDACDAGGVAALLNGAVPFLMVTDPPYGVNYDPAWRQRAAEAGHLPYAARRVGEVSNDNRADWSDAYRLFPGAVAYTWAPGGDLIIVFGGALQSVGFALRSMVIWSKPHFAIGRGHYHWRHEPCWYGVRKGETANWIGDRKQTTVWEVSLDRNVEGGHSTQKPVECMARPIRNHDAPEVYDPFLGSGTTLIACEQLNRRCYGIEIEPRYVDVIIKRWENFTGKKAELLEEDIHAGRQAQQADA